MADVPRVHEILASSEITKGSQYFKPRYLTRGTLVHSACAIVGRGGTIDPLWWERSSGNQGTVGTPFDDYVSHAECKPYVAGYTIWQERSKWWPSAFELLVSNPRGPYCGHIDQVGIFENAPTQHWVLDLKNGEFEPWHKLSLALYAAAYFAQTKKLPRRACLYLPAGKLVEFTDVQDINKALVMVDYHHLVKEFRS